MMQEQPTVVKAAELITKLLDTITDKDRDRAIPLSLLTLVMDGDRATARRCLIMAGLRPSAVNQDLWSKTLAHNYSEPKLSPVLSLIADAVTDILDDFDDDHEDEVEERPHLRLVS